MSAIYINKEIAIFKQMQNKKKAERQKKNNEELKKQLEVKSINRILLKDIVSVREFNFLNNCEQVQCVKHLGLDFKKFKIVNKYLVIYNDRVNLIYC